MPIIVNKVEITDDEVHAEMQYHPAETMEGARHKAAEALVIRQLLIQEAIQQKLLHPENSTSMEHIDEAIDALLKKEVTVPEAKTENCQRYYEQNQERFIDKKTDKVLPFDAVENHIRNYLHARSLQTGLGHYIKVLSGQARIAGFSMEGSDSPLVQ